MTKDNAYIFVTVRIWGYSGGVEEAIKGTEEFTNLLAAMKFYLEHGIEPNLVMDHAPDARVFSETRLVNLIRGTDHEKKLRNQ